jgi:hypothetical protein
VVQIFQDAQIQNLNRESGGGPQFEKEQLLTPAARAPSTRREIMTAVLYDDVVTSPPAARLTVTHAPRQASKQASGRPRQSPIGAGGDPMVDAAARLLSIPLRQLYAVLWRVGLIEVTA